MMILCVQCAMRALIEDRAPPMFEGTLEEHMAQYHPDPIATQTERVELEKQLREKGLM